jgi:hypothetical protein
MTITVIVRNQTRAEKRYGRAVRKYSAAVQALAGLRDGSLTAALMRAHEAHIEMLAVANGSFLKGVPFVRRELRDPIAALRCE